MDDQSITLEAASPTSLKDRSKQFILNLSIDAGLSALATAIVDQAMPGGLGPDSVIFGTMIGKATAELGRLFLESEDKPENLQQLLRRSAGLGLLAGMGYLGIDLLAQNPINLPPLTSLFSSPETTQLAASAASGVQEVAPQVVGQVTVESPLTLADAITTAKNALPYIEWGTMGTIAAVQTALIAKFAQTLPDHARAWWQEKIDWKNQKLAQVGEKVITVSEFLQEHGQKLADLAPSPALAAPPILSIQVIAAQLGPDSTQVQNTRQDPEQERGAQNFYEVVKTES